MTKAGKKTVNTLLQRSESILIDGKEYMVPAPTYGTLVMLSGYINEADINLKEDIINVADILHLAKEEATAPEVLAILILGAKECDKREVISKEVTKKRFGIFPYKEICRVESDKTKFDILSDYFRYEVAISEIVTAINEILNNRMDLGFFYRGIATLKRMNLIKPTKEI